MNHDIIIEDPAFPIMTLDILNNMLSRSDNPGQLAKYLTEEIRELTGARCVLLVQCLGKAHKVIDINPERLRTWAESSEAHHLYELIHTFTETQLWRLNEPSKISSLLQTKGFGVSITVPLRVGAEPIGAMLLLGLPDEQHIETEIKLLTTLSKVLTLVLRNSLLYESQEKAIEERTKELMKSEKRFRAVFERSTIAKALTLPDGKLLKVNQAFCDLIGYSLEEIPQLNFIDITHPEDIAKSRESIRCLLANEQTSCRMEKRYIHKSGKLVWTDVSTTLLRDEDGTNLYFITSISDVSERKHSEKALQQSKSLFQKVFNSQLDAIFILNADQPPVVVECNIAAKEIFGYPADGLVGDSVHNLHISEAHFKKFQDTIYSEIEKHGFVKDVHYSMKRKDGTIFPTEHVVLEMKNKKKERTGWIFLVRDLTERKQLESRLQQAQKMEAMGTLAGGIAHDFNNILSPILGFSEMLYEDLPEGSPEQESISEIFHAALRAKELVKQILTFSRQSDQKLKPIKLQSILKEALKLLRSSIPRTIDIQTDIDPDCGVVISDPIQIHQIIMNLATNAYHAMQASGGKLNVSLRQTRIESIPMGFSELTPGEYARLSVTDTGMGIKKNILGKIFDPYFSTKEKGKGTGLGLSIVQGIVKSCNGDIHVYSEPGIGTEVNVYLPIMEKAGHCDSPDPSEPIQKGSENILLVDDERAILKMEAQILGRLGYCVTPVSGSMEALDVFKETPDSFDLVISDMTMPDMTGLQLANEIKAIRPDIPIIICTGFSDQINDENFTEMGIQGYVVKPVITKEFVQTIRAVLNISTEKTA